MTENDRAVQVPASRVIDRDALILTVRDVSADHHGNGWLSLSGPEAARIADAVIALLSQPPVSLPTRDQIAEAMYRDEQHEDHLWAEEQNEATRAAYLHTADVVRALFTQLTPTAEPKRIPLEIEKGVFLSRWEDNKPVEPPRIEDMAPGTTFQDAQGVVYLRMIPRGDGYDFTDSRGYFWFSHQIDPSTIRDVTPPGADR